MNPHNLGVFVFDNQVYTDGLGKSLYLDEPSTKGEINSDSEEKENS